MTKAILLFNIMCSIHYQSYPTFSPNTKIRQNRFHIIFDGMHDRVAVQRFKIMHKGTDVTKLLAIETYEESFGNMMERYFNKHAYLSYCTNERLWHQLQGHFRAKKRKESAAHICSWSLRVFKDVCDCISSAVGKSTGAIRRSVTYGMRLVRSSLQGVCIVVAGRMKNQSDWLYQELWLIRIATLAVLWYDILTRNALLGNSFRKRKWILRIRSMGRLAVLNLSVCIN